MDQELFFVRGCQDCRPISIVGVRCCRKTECARWEERFGANPNNRSADILLDREYYENHLELPLLEFHRILMTKVIKEYDERFIEVMRITKEKKSE